VGSLEMAFFLEFFYVVLGGAEVVGAKEFCDIFVGRGVAEFGDEKTNKVQDFFLLSG